MSTDRRALCFERTIQSICCQTVVNRMEQRIEVNSNFSIFIGISGTEEYNTKAFGTIAKAALTGIMVAVGISRMMKSAKDHNWNICGQ
ncbi:MAG: hypothetical protein ACI8RD_004203 [Bacillariaceae sp.]|jgi:hypothetical protein